MVELVHTPLTTPRDGFRRKSATIISSDDADILAALKSANAIKKHTARVALSQVFAMSKVLAEVGINDQVVRAFRALVAAMPPSGHMRAAGGGPSRSATGVPAEVEPTSDEEAAGEPISDEEADGEFIADAAAAHGARVAGVPAILAPTQRLFLLGQVPVASQRQVREAVAVPSPSATGVARAFPTTLPKIVLMPQQARERYGIEAHARPKRLRDEIQDFKNWSSDAINTERTMEYAGAVQSTTLEKLSSVICAYVGYAVTVLCLSQEETGLDAYANPHMLARFLGYLKARNVARGHLNKHIAVAKKINVYLAGGAEDGSDAKLHARRMCDMLAMMETQISLSMPAATKRDLPEASDLYRWARRICDEAVLCVEDDQTMYGHITHKTAWAVETAIMVAMVTGAYMPPGRLHLIKTILHPDFAGKVACQDKDCLLGDCCKGNHMEIVDIEESGDGKYI